MEEKLERLYNECINELKSINIDINDSELIGSIDIKISKRASKRYGCCKQEDPDKNYFHVIRRGRRKYIKYDRYKKHHIEISKWVMDLDENIIKDTIMHEIIHCFPYCSNHGKEFKKYANYINENLEYNIKTVGNKKDDYKKSNIEYKDDAKEYKYKVICKKCGQIYYRQRLKKNFIRLYRCSKCEGKLKLLEEK